MPQNVLLFSHTNRNVNNRNLRRVFTKPFITAAFKLARRAPPLCQKKSKRKTQSSLFYSQIKKVITVLILCLTTADAR